MRIWFGLILKGCWDGEEVECVCGGWVVVGMFVERDMK